MMLKNKYTIIITFLILSTGIYWLYFAANRGIWLDELDWTLGFLYQKSILETITELLRYGYNLPLFYILLKPFYYFSQNLYILYFPSVFCSMMGVVMLYKIGIKLYGKLFAFILCIITITSPLICYEIASQIRPYGLLFFLSILTLYTYINRIETENTKNIVLYALISSCFLYTHWFASLMLLTYALTDLYLWIRKRIEFRCIISYMICGSLFFPWIIAVFFLHKTSFQDYWGMQIPDIKVLLDCFSYLVGYNTLLFFICVLIFIKIFLSFLFGVRNDKKHKLDWPNQFLFSCLFILFFIWFYTIIFPKASLFVFRYFKIFLPQMLLLVSWGIWSILSIRFNLCSFFFLTKIPFKYLRYYCLIGILFIAGYIVIINMPFCKNTFADEFYDFNKIPDLLSQEKLDKKTLILTHNSSFFYTFFNISKIADIDLAVDRELETDAQKKNRYFSVSYVIKDGKKLTDYMKKDFSSLLEYDSVYTIPEIQFNLWLNRYIKENFICVNRKVFDQRMVRLCHPKK